MSDKPPTPASLSAPLLTAHRITKRYGHVEALRGAEFDVYAGEVVALVGDNGAGKSTLVKVLAGAIQPDSGKILLNGRPTLFSSPADARALGIETVYQDLALAPDLDIAANLFLGRELVKPGPFGFLGPLDRRQMRHRARQVLDDLGVTIPDQSARLASLSGGQRQGVAVARAAIWAKHVIFLDEPTAALGVRQVAQVEALIKQIRQERGVAIVLVSHNMQQVISLADRIHVLRLGERVATFDAKSVKPEHLVAAITGLYRQQPEADPSGAILAEGGSA